MATLKAITSNGITGRLRGFINVKTLKTTVKIDWHHAKYGCPVEDISMFGGQYETIIAKAKKFCDENGHELSI